MRRLYHQFYLTIIASLLMVVLAAGALWRFAPNDTPADRAFEIAGELARCAPGASRRRVGGAAAGDRPVAHAARHRSGAVCQRPPAARGRGPSGAASACAAREWRLDHRTRRAGLGYPRTGRTLDRRQASCAAAPPRCRHHHLPWHHRARGRDLRLPACALADAPAANGCRPVWSSLGAGELSARVKVEGRDEVARLAASFNNAAARIEELVSAHKMLLANTSHELRTPLSRIRLGIELIQASAGPARKAALEKDIAELDGLIEQILLSSRLDATKAVEAPEEVDLLALAAEEAARYEQCAAAGVPVFVTGNRGLLQRMVRNLLDNAERHGAPPDRGRCPASRQQSCAQRRRSWRRSRAPRSGAHLHALLPAGREQWSWSRAGPCPGPTDRKAARRRGGMGRESGRGGRHLGVAPSFGSAAHLSSAARYACPLSLLPFSSPRPKREERRRFSGNGRASSGRPQC